MARDQPVGYSTLLSFKTNLSLQFLEQMRITFKIIFPLLSLLYFLFV